MTKKDLVRYKEVRLADLRNDQKTAAQILNADAASDTQEQFQEFVLSQIKRIIHGDHSGIWKDDFRSQDILDLQDISFGVDALAANCLSTDVVGAAVRVTGPALGGIYQVATCDISMAGGYPAIGLIFSKSSPTNCIVQTRGPIVTVVDLTPGKTYFVGFDGQPIAAPLPSSLSGHAAIQALGTALDVNILHLEVTPTRFVRAG